MAERTTGFAGDLAEGSWGHVPESGVIRALEGDVFIDRRASCSRDPPAPGAGGILLRRVDRHRWRAEALADGAWPEKPAPVADLHTYIRIWPDDVTHV